MSDNHATPPEHPVVLERLDGVETGSLEDIRAAYQLGDFRYQLITRKGFLRPIYICSDPETRDELLDQMKKKKGRRVIIALSAKK